MGRCAADGGLDVFEATARSVRRHQCQEKSRRILSDGGNAKSQPSSLIRPTFMEFWEWLYASSGGQHVVAWDATFMQAKNEQFSPFNPIRQAEAQRWNWVCQKDITFDTDLNSVWRVFAVKFGYQTQLKNELDAIFFKNHIADKTNYFSYAEVWGESYYLYMMSLYLQAAERLEAGRGQMEYYAHCSLALECALDKFKSYTAKSRDKMPNLAALRERCFTALLQSQHPEPERIVGLLLGYYVHNPAVLGGIGESLKDLSEQVATLFNQIDTPLSLVATPSTLTFNTNYRLAANALEKISTYLLYIRLLPNLPAHNVFQYCRQRYWFWLENAYQGAADNGAVQNVIDTAANKLPTHSVNSHAIDPNVRRFRELWLEVTSLEHLELLGTWARISPALVGAGLVSAAKWSLLSLEQAEKFSLNICLAHFLTEWRNRWQTVPIDLQVIPEPPSNWPA